VLARAVAELVPTRSVSVLFDDGLANGTFASRNYISIFD
jgi:hypothetical protein